MVQITALLMILTGSSEIATRVRAFSDGADDYMTKSPHEDQLVARIMRWGANARF